MGRRRRDRCSPLGEITKEIMNAEFIHAEY